MNITLIHSMCVLIKTSLFVAFCPSEGFVNSVVGHDSAFSPADLLLLQRQNGGCRKQLLLRDKG